MCAWRSHSRAATVSMGRANEAPATRPKRDAGEGTRMADVKCSCCDETVQVWVTLWSLKDIVICYQCLDYLNSRRAKQIATHGGLKPLAGYDLRSAFSMSNERFTTTNDS